MSIEDRNAQALAEGGIAAKGYRIVKGIDGSMSAVREFDITDDDDSADFPNRGQRVGDARVMSPIIVREQISREYATAGAMTVPLDPFLAQGNKDGDVMIGGQNVSGRQIRPPQGYVYDEPNVDRRDAANFPGERSESGIASVSY